MEHRREEEYERGRDEDLKRTQYGNFGYYNPPYLRDTGYWAPAGNPFFTPYGSYKRFDHRDYTKVFARGQHTGRGPRGYQRSDERILEDVNERLTEHGEIDASDIEVQVENGEVTLSGAVDSRQTKRLAEDLVESVSGVKDVHNQLRVGRPQVAESRAY